MLFSKRFGLLALAAVCWLGAAVAARAANPVANGAFETWSGSPLQADGWGNTDPGQESTYVQSTTMHGGSFAAFVTPEKAYGGIRQKNIAVTPGQAYLLKVWMRGGATGGDDTVRLLAVCWADSGPQFFITDTASQGGLSDTEYREYSLVIPVPAGTTSLELQFGAYQDPTTNPISFYLDDMTLDLVQAPAQGLLINGDYELWSGSPSQALAWNNTAAGQDSTYVKSTTAHGGSFAAAVTPTQAYGGIRQLNLAPKANTKYRLTAWMRGNGTGEDDIVRLLAVAWATSGPQFFTAATNNQGGLLDSVWQQYVLEFTTPADITGMEVQFGAFQDPATNPISFLIDDVSLTEVLPGSVINGSFETWAGSPLQADPWVNTDPSQPSTYEQSTTAHGGSFSAKVIPTGAYAGIRQLNIPVLPDHQYTLEAWLRGAGTGGDDVVRLLVVEQGSIFDVTDTTKFGGLSDDHWTLTYLQFKTDPATTSIEIQFGAYQDPATNPISFLIDDVALRDGFVPVELSSFSAE